MSIAISNEWNRLSASSREAPIALVRMYYGDESEYIAFAEKEIDFQSIFSDTALLTESGIALETESGERFLVSIPEAIIFDGDHYLGIVEKLPDLSGRLNLEAHTWAVSTFDLEISNVEYQPGSRFSDFITTIGSVGDKGFYNRKIEIRLYAEGITTWENCFPLFTGFTRMSSQSWDKLTFECDDGSLLQNTTIPNNAITTADSPGATGIADGAEGKQKQIVYGDSIFILGDIIRSTFTSSQNNIMVRCIDLGLGDLTAAPERIQRHYQISGHELNQIEAVWALDPATGRLVEVVSFDVIQNNSDGAIIAIDQDAEFYDYWFGDGTNTLFVGVNTWVDLGRANDRFADTAATQGDASAQTHEINFPAYSESVLDDSITEISIWAFAERTFTSAPGPVFTISSAFLSPIDVGAASAFDAVQYGTTAAANRAFVGAPVYVGYETNAVGDDANFYEVYKRVKYIPENSENLEIFASCKGAEYGNWIKNRTGHIDDGASGDAIENAAGIIESILRDRMGLVDSDIDSTQFNTLSNQLSDFDLAFNIYNNRESEDVLKMVLRDCRSYLWQNSGRLWTCHSILDTYSAADWVIDFNEIQGVKFSQTSLEDIKPYINIRYFFESQQRSNQLEYKADNVDTLKFYNISEIQGTEVIETNTIKDLTAATNLGDFEQANSQLIHNIFSGSMDKLYLPIDMGDIISITNMTYKVGGEDITRNQTRLGQTIYKYWFVYQVVRGERVSIKAIQLHDLS